MLDMIDFVPHEKFKPSEDGSPQLIQFDNFSIGIEYEARSKSRSNTLMKLTLVDTDFLPPDVWVDLVRHIHTKIGAGFWRTLFVSGRMVAMYQDLSENDGLLLIDEYWNWK